jgi:GntR family transcriptional regulator
LGIISGNIRLDFRSEEPIYLQIVRQVEKLVRDGILKPGDQLPTVRQLAIDLRINFSTVARAYHVLDEKKLISTQRGRGTYIWENGNPTGPEQPAAGLERSQIIDRLASDFVAGALRAGASLDEIERAVAQEITSRRSLSV